MQLLKRNFFYTTLAGMLVLLALAALLNSCDVFESEVSPDKGKVGILQKSIVITPKSSGIIDLQSMVGSTGNSRISITSQPSLGTLQSMGGGIVKYTPHAGITSGRDRLLLSIYSDKNVLEAKDSIVVDINSDTTNIPCSLAVIAQNDLIYNVSGPIDIDVLANDTVCQVSRSALVVSIPDNLGMDGVLIPKSYFGTLEVLPNGKIRYTPGPNFTKEDKFIYQVTKPEGLPQAGDFATVGYGYVYLSAVITCKDSLKLENDDFTFGLDSIAVTDSLYLNTAANDVLCLNALNDFQFTIKEFPAGQLFYGHDYGFIYLRPVNAIKGKMDKFSYRLCIDGSCKEAEVVIRFE